MSEITVREFIRNYENGRYQNSDRDTMIDAGWYDWFCEDEELKPRLDAMFPKVKQIATSSKINVDRMFVFFKNNCPLDGEIYDDFRFCEMESGDVVYTITPESGHKRIKGRSEVWGKENNFKEELAGGTWEDITSFFGFQKRHETRYKVNGIAKVIGKFGKSTKEEFDEAIASLPFLIKSARDGDYEAGQTAHSLLWELANESVHTMDCFSFWFGQKEVL